MSSINVNSRKKTKTSKKLLRLLNNENFVKLCEFISINCFRRFWELRMIFFIFFFEINENVKYRLFLFVFFYYEIFDLFLLIFNDYFQLFDFFVCFFINFMQFCKSWFIRLIIKFIRFITWFIRFMFNFQFFVLIFQIINMLFYFFELDVKLRIETYDC